MNTLTFYLMRESNRRGFCNSGMTYQRRLYFCCAEPMTADLDHVIYAADDPEIAFLVTFRRIPGQILAGIFAPILIDIAIRVAINCTQHRGPGIFDDEVALGILWDGISFVIYHFRFLSKKRTCARSRLERYSRSRRDHEHAGLGLPPGVHDRTFFLADHAVVPSPSFGVYRFANCTQQAEGREIMFVGPRFTIAHQAAD